MIRKIRHKDGYFQANSIPAMILDERSYWIEQDTDRDATFFIFKDGRVKPCSELPIFISEKIDKGVWVVFEQIGHERIDGAFPTLTYLLSLKTFMCGKDTFELLEDDLGYILSKSGDTYRTYVLRAGVWRDILIDILS